MDILITILTFLAPVGLGLVIGWVAGLLLILFIVLATADGMHVNGIPVVLVLLSAMGALLGLTYSLANLIAQIL